jgi:non-ribosomal peptide synthetase component E (peptide arylation enzyme)
VVQSRQETSKPTSAGRKVFRVLMERKFITEGFYTFLGFGVSVRDVSQRLKPEGFYRTLSQVLKTCSTLRGIQ